MASSCTSRPRTSYSRSRACTDLYLGGREGVDSVRTHVLLVSLCGRRRPACDHAATSSRSPVRTCSGSARFSSSTSLVSSSWTCGCTMTSRGCARGPWKNSTYFLRAVLRCSPLDFISTSSLHLAGTRPCVHAPVYGGFWMNFRYSLRDVCARAVRTWKSEHFFCVPSLVDFFLRLDSGYMFLVSARLLLDKFPTFSCERELGSCGQLTSCSPV